MPHEHTSAPIWSYCHSWGELGRIIWGSYLHATAASCLCWLIFYNTQLSFSGKWNYRIEAQNKLSVQSRQPTIRSQITEFCDLRIYFFFVRAQYSSWMKYFIAANAGTFSMLSFLIVSAKKRGINAVRLIHGYVGLQKYFFKVTSDFAYINC